jgi:hypothetical protein
MSSEVLLLQDERAVVVHRVRAADRLAARWHALDLDRRLAAGVPPEAAAALTLRAGILLRPRERKRMAGGLRKLIGFARRPPAVPAGVVVARAEVAEAARRLEALAARLEGAEPVDVRGVALARLLITDGAGPLYVPGRPGALSAAVEEALDALAFQRASAP